MALAAEGAELVILARGKDALEATAAEIRSKTGAKVTTVACDITTPEGRKAALGACPSPDILVNNAGGPPPGDFREWDRAAWIKALDANMLTPIELIRATVDEKLSAPAPEPAASSPAASTGASGGSSEAAPSPSPGAATQEPYTETPDLEAVCSVS